MRQFIQTSELVKEVMISVFQSVFPELPTLETSPMLYSEAPEKPAWLWMLPDGRCISYFGTEFKLLNKFPLQNKVSFQMDGTTDICPFKAYQAEYNIEGGVTGKGFVVELDLGNYDTTSLLKFYDQGLVFGISKDEWIRPNYSQSGNILIQVLENYDKRNAQ